MIRSLVITPNAEYSASENTAGQVLLRHNLSQESLEKCFADGDTMWIDICAPEDDEIHWLERLLQLSATVVDDLLREDRRPTLLVYPRYLFLSLFQPHSQNKAIVGKEIHCIIGEHFYVTVWQKDASALEEAYNRVVQNPELWHRGVAYFLYLTAQHTIDTYYPLLDHINDQLHALEEKFLNDRDDKQAQKSVYRIKQHLIRLRQMIAPQREVLSNLMGETRISENSDIRDLFRHLYERLLGIYDVIDSQRDLTSSVLEVVGNQHSRQIGEAVNRLTIISLVFLPFTFFLGLFDAGFFDVSETMVLPINGLILAFLTVVVMIAVIVTMRSIFQHRGWV